ncbi:alkaline phosphatase [Ophiocordyceps camponoti-floridani]|uniref:Alkaline phosphatase n=1 Tax=Ophiocordyceps camponoti-floridani TaxID=2030778 RepID=A0A8H4VD56_9HYPO|nr:alkaline phosphatase [Ophiocordyceps camponoti-floridani]
MPQQSLPRIITYYQTHRTADNKPISILPLANPPSATHVILAALHVNESPSALTLNDDPVDSTRYTTLWAELRVLQASGVKVLAMLGGAAQGTFSRLDLGPSLQGGGNEDGDDAFEAYYAPLRRLIRHRSLDGLDLDVEEDTSLAGIIRLIDRLRQDFGSDFIITLAPVAAALLDPASNLSGFDYEALEVLRGREIAWYNAQFYCGWGDLSSTRMYDYIIAKGWPPKKVVIGLVTNPANGKGFVPWPVLEPVLGQIANRHRDFGGVMGWEYFNGLPGDTHRPWEWARLMARLLRPNHRFPNAEPTPAPVGATPVFDNVADPDANEGHPVPLPNAFEYVSDGDDSRE